MPLQFDSISLLLTGFAIAVVAAVIAVIRRPAFPVLGQGLIGLGLLLTAVAAGGPFWRRPVAVEVAVAVDLSPSTRTAGYRDRAALDRRILQLLGDAPYHVSYFARDRTPTVDDASPLGDLPADRTRYEPPTGAAAVLLFSDGRFDSPPGGPPTYPVIDAALEAPPDASVNHLELRDGDAVVAVSNPGPPRALIIDGTTGPRRVSIPTGPLVVRQAVRPGATLISAQLTPGDAWPENDGLTIHVPPATTPERWWVGGGPAPGGGWRLLAAAQLPGDATAYLAPAVIVLRNVPATDLSIARQQRLAQYVRTLGGSLVVGGGDHAFAAGAYPGSVLESLSPLSSTPPQPATHWMLLVDGSGSMSSAAGPGAGAATRWETATAALRKLLPGLPPEDPVTIGSFSDVVRWWSTGKRSADTARLALPPGEIGPQGPTNLERALQGIAASAGDGMPVQLLLLTDADTQINAPDELGAALAAEQIHLHLLVIGDGNGTAITALRQIIGTTGGSFLQQPDPNQWLSSLEKMMRGASPPRLIDDPVRLKFNGPLGGLPGRTVRPWDRTWLRPQATALAETVLAGERVVMAAAWASGAGRVLAAAFGPDPSEVEAMARMVARPPRDPRFAVTWEPGARLTVRVDALDGDASMNGLAFALDVARADEGGEILPATELPQTAPGRYELSIDAPRFPVIATLRGPGAAAVDRLAVAGRYAAEFDGIGNDHTALRTLADRTGGGVIPPSQTTPINFRRPRREVPLASWLATAGAVCIAAALVGWQIKST